MDNQSIKFNSFYYFHIKNSTKQGFKFLFLKKSFYFLIKSFFKNKI